MASFFQPSVLSGYVNADSRFLVYSDSALAYDELTRYWYQDLVIALGCTAFIIGCISFAVQVWQSTPDSKEPFLKRQWTHLGHAITRVRALVWRTAADEEPAKEVADKAHPLPKIGTDLATVKSYQLMDENSFSSTFRINCDLCIQPISLSPAMLLPVQGQTQHSRPASKRQSNKRLSTRYSHWSLSAANAAFPEEDESQSFTSDANTRRRSRAQSIAQSVAASESRISIDLAARSNLSYGSFSLKTNNVEHIASLSGRSNARVTFVLDLLVRHSLDGAVLELHSNDDAEEIRPLLRRFQEENIPLLLSGSADLELFDQLDLGVVDGLIVSNASILLNGDRRDFFRSARVRDLAARVKRQRKYRPEFFLAFLEVYEAQPSAATVRRAHKLADFFDAILYVKPKTIDFKTRAPREISLSGFDWLKRSDVASLQKQWLKVSRVSFDTEATGTSTLRLNLAKLDTALPGAGKLMESKPLTFDLRSLQQEPVHEAMATMQCVMPEFEGASFWESDVSGQRYCQTGCFALRDELYQEDYNYIVKSQRHMKDIAMLHTCSAGEMLNICASIESIESRTSHPELVNELCKGLRTGLVQIHRGLDSGFTLPDNRGHAWAVCDVVETDGVTVLDVYVSQKTVSEVATIWHTYLAKHGVPRLERFQEEMLFPARDGMVLSDLPLSLRKELENSTEAELLSMLRRISIQQERTPIEAALVDQAEQLLISDSTRNAWNALHSRACLDDSLSVPDLMRLRLEDFARRGATQLPEHDGLIEVYDQLENAMSKALFWSDRTTLEKLFSVLTDVYSSASPTVPVDIASDLYGLMFFCVLRRLAYEDIYFETTDRCPLFLQQHDQAGVFSELWVLGSQCELYFGILPRALGEVTYDRYRQFLELEPPPTEAWDGKNVFTAYSTTEPKIRMGGHDTMTGSGSPVELPGLDPGFRSSEPGSTMSMREATQKLGALSIFAFPAIIDVILLTFLGRGFYLTAFMDDDTLLMADYAVLAALIMTGGITGWVGSSGGFYLFSGAFDNMVHFLVQRFSAAFVLTCVVALCGGFAFSQEYSWFAGFVFVMYLFALTTFLNLLGIFATLHRFGSPLTSGRLAMWRWIPILFISPVLTSFVNGHDLLIYLLVIYTFVITLLIQFRNLCHEWTTWQALVPTTKEKDLLDWYTAKLAKSGITNPDMSAAAPAARQTLQLEVSQYSKPRWWTFGKSKVQDPFVEKMALGHPFAIWMLEKEAAGAALPDMYTTTWFVQLELALANQKQLGRGLKEHSQFILFRYSKYDLGQNVGLFLAALMDRWVDITMSARHPTINLYTNYRTRYSICFGLLYFLIGAVAVDTIIQRHWTAGAELTDDRIGNIGDFDRIVASQKRRRRQNFRKALRELMTLLLIIFGFTTILLWFLVQDHTSIIQYFTYISGYTGVLIFQFNRPFTKSVRWHVMTIFIFCAIAFVVGCVLRAANTTASFYYDFVIALNIASVPSAIVTFLLTGYISIPFLKEKKVRPQTDEQTQMDEKPMLRKESCFSTHSTSTRSLSESKSSTITGATLEMVKDLCLGVDVNNKWQTLPEDIRILIINRIVGRPAQITSTARGWLDSEDVDLRKFSEQMERHSHNLRTLANSKKEYGNTDVLMTVKPGQSTTPELGLLIPKPHARKPFFTLMGNIVSHSIYSTVKWIAIISGGAPDVGRELWFTLRHSPFNAVTLWILLKAWKVCWWVKNFWTYVFLVAGTKRLEPLLQLAHRGDSKKLDHDSIIHESPLGTVSGFISRDETGNIMVTAYNGSHKTVPTSQQPQARAYYDSSYRLQKREDLSAGPEKAATAQYHYSDAKSRWPVSRSAIEAGIESISQYDKHGRVVKGRLWRGGQELEFEYLYRMRPRGNTDVLQASYTNTPGNAEFSLKVYWCIQPRTKVDSVQLWVPSDKLQRVIATSGDTTYEITWRYTHARHADIETFKIGPDGDRITAIAPASIINDDLGLCKKPRNVAFDKEDLLVHHPLRYLKRAAPSGSSSSLSKFLSTGRQKTIYQKLPTSAIRTSIWQTWEKGQLDAVSACYLDEMTLREEPLLSKYWRLRDAGYFRKAADVLDENLERIISAIEPSAESSQKCPLVIKSSDLFSMGLGKDANQLTARLDDAYRDTQSQTSVIFSDNGCWPDNPGGVSNCRRDLINGHTTIRGHCMAESANDFGIPRYQIEQNVNSLKILPLWGLDGKTPYHGLLDNLLQSQIDERIHETRLKEDIEEVFIPLLMAFIKGARTRRYTREDLVTYSNVVLRMNAFFEKADFNKVWANERVWYAWVQAWLYEYDDPNITSPNNFLEIEKPSMSDFRDALNLYICYFFIFSVEVPGRCPTVYQTTHHGISSLYGLLMKFRRRTTWGIWDHAILWRETCLNISPAQCLLPIPVQAMLLAGIKLACHLAYTHVDIVLPCTSVFNPDWEQDLGTDQGLRGSKKLFSRKIDPIVNGIGNMDAFQPVKEIRSKFPTTVMLSNVQFIKDVKTAVLAADVIINKFGFEDYRLKVYGAQDRQPSYALETTTMIAARKLGGKVILAGFGSPKEVLKDAWLFMNSSLSEGLPLAIGEAALSGIPIVATEVGATALVLTDPDDSSKRYGEVVPPNDPEALARAQIQLLAMMGPWAQYTDDKVAPPPLPDKFTKNDVEWITKRMYDKTADRQKLGLKLRDVVLRSFHGNRYLREHEQMYWIQRRWAEYRRSDNGERQKTVNEYFGDSTVFEYDSSKEKVLGTRPRWQNFDMDEVKGVKSVKAIEA